MMYLHNGMPELQMVLNIKTEGSAQIPKGANLNYLQFRSKKSSCKIINAIGFAFR